MLTSEEEETDLGGGGEGLWSWGCGEWGRLGLNNMHTKLLPSHVRPKRLDGLKVIHLSAGGFHNAGT
jgi:alpha-tubulin suppressor-like RCC1 family protein